MIANLDEFVSTFRKRQDIINDQFDKYLNNKTYFKDLMTEYILFIYKLQYVSQLISDTSKSSRIDSNIQYVFDLFLYLNLSFSPNIGIFLKICLKHNFNHFLNLNLGADLNIALYTLYTLNLSLS